MKITRTLKIYSYAFGNLDLDTMQISDMEVVTSLTKLGPRKVAALSKEKGKAMLNMSVKEELYGMDIEEFYKWGVPLTKDEAANEGSAPGDEAQEKDDHFDDDPGDE